MRALERQWLILSRLPAPPRKVDARWLESELRDAGVTIHRRTIQRDLVALSRFFPLACDEQSKPYGWSWSAEAAFPRTRLMSAHLALLVVLGARVFEAALPRATVAFVRGEVAFAEQVLARAGPPLATWPERVRGAVKIDAARVAIGRRER
jgi:hypothetical protein